MSKIDTTSRYGIGRPIMFIRGSRVRRIAAYRNHKQFGIGGGSHAEKWWKAYGW